jgi:hypothetical protein
MAVTYFPNMQQPAESTSAQAGKGDGTKKPTNKEIQASIIASATLGELSRLKVEIRELPRHS